jgi:hypothetical protein
MLFDDEVLKLEDGQNYTVVQMSIRVEQVEVIKTNKHLYQ